MGNDGIVGVCGPWRTKVGSRTSFKQEQGKYGRIWSEGSSLISEVDESSSYHVPGKHRSMNAHQVGRNAVNQI